MQIDKEKVVNVYKPGGWVDLEIFRGNYFNFGYWEASVLKKNKFNISDRIVSSQNLYRQTVNHLNICSSDRILDIGCGHGVGAAFVSERYKPAYIDAIDITPTQILAAQNLLRSSDMPASNMINFTNCDICSTTPFHNETFDKIYSVEALQHFESIPNFASETARILKPQGSLAIAACFSINQESHAKLDFAAVDNVEIHYDLNSTIDELKKNGIKLVAKTCISEYVFPGYQRWLRQSEVKNPFSFMYHEAYKKGLLHYWILHFQKC